MKILIICYSYAPNSNPRALRWTALSEEWANRGMEVHVITSKSFGQMGHEIRNGVHVYRVGWGMFSGLRRWVNESSAIPQERDKKNQNSHLTISYALSSPLLILRKFLRLSHDLIWRPIYWPDATCFWIWPAARYAIRLGRQHAVDVMVTVSHPFSGHVVGLIAKRFLHRLTWLADSGDPFSFSIESASNNYRIWKMLNFFVEGKLINTVDAFCVTTQETAVLYKRYFPEGSTKLVVIPPLINPSFFDARSLTKDRPAGCEINLLFVGTFYRDLRSPVPFLDLLKKLLFNSNILYKYLKFYIIGSTNIVAEVLQHYPDLRDKVLLLGKVPHCEAVNSMLSADCLVNVGNSTSYQLPSKLIEYMATGNPILNISSISDDLSSKMLQNYPGGYNWTLYNDNDNDLDALCRFLEACRGQTLSVEQRNSLVAPFCLASVSAQYLSALSGTSGPH